MTSTFLSRLKTIVGPNGLITDAIDIDSYVRDWRGNYVGKTNVVVRPANTGELLKMIAVARHAVENPEAAPAAAFRDPAHEPPPL